MPVKRKSDRYPLLNLNPVELRRKLALLKLGKLSLVPKKTAARRPN